MKKKFNKKHLFLPLAIGAVTGLPLITSSCFLSIDPEIKQINVFATKNSIVTKTPFEADPNRLDKNKDIKDAQIYLSKKVKDAKYIGFDEHVFNLKMQFSLDSKTISKLKNLDNVTNIISYYLQDTPINYQYLRIANKMFEFGENDLSIKEFVSSQYLFPESIDRVFLSRFLNELNKEENNTFEKKYKRLLQLLVENGVNYVQTPEKETAGMQCALPPTYLLELQSRGYNSTAINEEEEIIYYNVVEKIKELNRMIEAKESNETVANLENKLKVLKEKEKSIQTDINEYKKQHKDLRALKKELSGNQYDQELLQNQINYKNDTKKSIDDLKKELANLEKQEKSLTEKSSNPLRFFRIPIKKDNPLFDEFIKDPIAFYDNKKYQDKYFITIEELKKKRREMGGKAYTFVNGKRADKATIQGVENSYYELINYGAEYDAVLRMIGNLLWFNTENKLQLGMLYNKKENKFVYVMEAYNEQDKIWYLYDVFADLDRIKAGTFNGKITKYSSRPADWTWELPPESETVVNANKKWSALAPDYYEKLIVSNKKVQSYSHFK